jgi:hypothetical protein
MMAHHWPVFRQMLSAEKAKVLLAAVALISSGDAHPQRSLLAEERPVRCRPRSF